MGRPKPNTDQSTGPDSTYAGGAAPSSAASPAAPQYYPPAYAGSQPATPYPPPPEPYPPAVNADAAPHYYPDVASGDIDARPTPYPPPSSSTPTAPVPFPPTRPPPPPPPPDYSNGGAAAFAYASKFVGEEQWSTDLYDCDMSQDYAIATAICPCVTFGQIAEIIDEGETSCLLAGLLYMVMMPALFTCSVLSSNYRRKLREKYNLVEAPSDDCSVHLINPCCALCQEYRELQKRGFDPSLGWLANLAQQQQATSTAPPGNQFMRR